MDDDIEDEDTGTDDNDEGIGINIGGPFPAIQRARNQVAASHAQFAESIDKMLEPIREQQRALAHVFREYYDEV